MGWVVLLGNVLISGGSQRLGRSLLSCAEAEDWRPGVREAGEGEVRAGEDRGCCDTEEEEEVEAEDMGLTPGMEAEAREEAVTEEGDFVCSDWPGVASRLIGTIRSFSDGCKNNQILFVII